MCAADDRAWLVCAATRAGVGWPAPSPSPAASDVMAALRVLTRHRTCCNGNATHPLDGLLLTCNGDTAHPRDLLPTPCNGDTTQPLEVLPPTRNGDTTHHL